MRVYALIIAGGIGERLWPLSRKNLPKQLLTLKGEKTLLNSTVERIEPICGKDNVFVLTSKNLKPLMEKALNIPEENIRTEPERRNTGPAIALGSYFIKKKYGDGVIVVLPSDHFIKKDEVFRKVIRKGVGVAMETGSLITIGITPDHPETGYGYIERGIEILDGAWKVKRFVEKPSIEKAKRFISKGNFFWNSGMLIGKVSSIIENVKEFLPSVYEGLEEIFEKNKKIEELYPLFPDISFDYGVLEKSNKILMIEGNFFWDDIGNWLAMERIFNKDSSGNIKIGDSLLLDSRNLIIWGRKGKLIATFGVKGLIIVDTDDALIVIDKSKAQDIKEMLKKLREKESLKKFL